MRCTRAALAVLLVAGCAAPRHHPRAVSTTRPPAPDGRVKVGQPYQVLGQWYYPKDDATYDVTGTASWYGPGFHGLSTASGERYDQDGISAAHKTLPLPSYVEVTNLDNGRVLTVRINDRGPFVGSRVIDLSRRSAQLLGVDRPGTAHVRVRRVFPAGTELAQLQPPRADVVPVPLPPAAAAPVVAVAIPSAPAGTIFVQVAALSDQGRAEWLQGYLKPYGATFVERTPAGLWRVRLGPFPTRDEATLVLAQVQTAGYTDARIVAATPAG